MEAHDEVAAGNLRSGELTAFLKAAARLGFPADQFLLSAYDATATSHRTPGRVISVHRGEFSRDFETFPGQGWCGPAVEALRAGHFGST